MIEDIVTFCEKTLENTKQKIENCVRNLKSFMIKEEFNVIEKRIEDNEEATKILLKRDKFKKFNYLKQNPQKRPIAIAEDNIEQQRKSYASVVEGNYIKAPLQKQSKTNLKPTLTIKEKLQVLHPIKSNKETKENYHQENNFATDNRNKHIKSKIKQLEDQTRKLKQSRTND